MNTIPYDELQQENIKLRQQVAYLQQQLSPPAPPARELKYWIVTWVYKDAQGDTRPDAAVAASWVYASDLQAGLKTTGRTNIRILEQIVFV